MADDPFVQAQKALSDRPPFDDDSAAADGGGPARDSTLPAAVAAVLHRNSDSRRKHKKSHSAAAADGTVAADKKQSIPSRQSKPQTIWDLTEDYFRPISLEDMELLASKTSINMSDSCFQIPNIGEGCCKDGFSIMDTKPAPLVDTVENEQAQVVVETELLDTTQIEELSVATPVQEKNCPIVQEDDHAAFNWILGSKQRCVLTSERPNKKRKLLGQDAGLDQLLRLPRLQEDVKSVICDVCCLGGSSVLNKIVSCSSCKVNVHQKCYGLREVGDEAWLCSWCKHFGMVTDETGESAAASVKLPCILCPKGGGALKPIGGISADNPKFAHLFCSIWTPEVFVEDTLGMEPILNVGGVQDMRTKLVCYLCKVKHGVCVRCSHGTCRTSFHPVCARDFKQKMEIWGKPGYDNVELRAFCSKHSATQANVQTLGNFDKATDETSPRSPSASQPSSAHLKLKLRLRNKDDSMKHETTNSLSDSMEKNISEQDASNISKSISREEESKLSKDGACSGTSSSCVQEDANDAGLNLPANDHPEPLPPQNKSKGDTREVLEVETVPSAGEVVSYEEGILDDDNSKDSLFLNKKVKGFAYDETCQSKEQPKMIGDDPCLEDSNPSSNLFVKPKENIGKEGGAVSEMDPVNYTYVAPENKIKEGSLLHENFDTDRAPHGSGLMSAKNYSSLFVHPFIMKQFMRSQSTLLQDKFEGMSNGAGEVDKDIHMNDAAVSEFCPEDEVEGEMVYYQHRLLENALTIKQTCEDLVSRIVKNLPQELDLSKSRKWDQVLVNQYLREVREAKKRGRREKKHKEAQAVLAAATAATACSTRVSSLRKDASDETTTAHQENNVMANTVAGRKKDGVSRLAYLKASSDKHSRGFQIPDFSIDNGLVCDICRRGETVLSRIFVCSKCKVAVHLDCYRKFKDPIGSWKCELCEELSLSVSSRNEDVSPMALCELCGGTSGAFRKSTGGQWVHAFCAEWLLESTFKRGQHNNVEGMEAMSNEKGMQSCSICHQKIGVCLKCSFGNCHATFHPSCARNTGLYMNVKSIGGKLHHKAYCAKHSLEQRQADIKQYGAEDLKNMKQMRVELEKLRLLCERIIRREKLKRDMVVCSHEIHARRRDCVAVSALVRSSLFPPCGSSQSATTSVDDKSYSGIQRSDDVTVDSTVCSSRALKFPVHMDINKRMDERSAAQLPAKRKLDDRTLFSGKQIPEGAKFVPLQNASDTCEKRSPKVRKNTEAFQKELVMTSIQASIQNKRLPKGFVYVPVDCLSEEKAESPNSESRETKEPGG